MPLLGWLAGRWLLDPEIRVGLFMSSSVPCTLASAVLWTRLGRGNEATALLAVLATTCLSWLITPAWLRLTTGTDVDLDIPAIMLELLKVLVLPVALAFVFRGSKPVARLMDRWRSPMSGVARLLVLVIILRAAVELAAQIQARELGLGFVLGPAAVSIGVHLSALTFGFWTSRALGMNRPNQIAVAISGSQKTLPVALYLFESHFHQFPLAVIPMLAYHVGQLVVDTFIAEYWVKHEPPSTPHLDRQHLDEMQEKD